MKRLLTVLTALLLMLALCACEQETVQESSDIMSQTDQSEEAVSETSSESDDLSNSDKGSEVTPLFWKVSGENGETIWLFGSIHAGTENYYPLPEAVLEAYNGSDYLAVEVDVVAFENDMQAATEVMKKLVYTDGTTIKDHIPEELYKRAVAVLTEGDMYSALFDYYIPSLWESLMTNICLIESGLDSDLGIDRYFLDSAKESGKEIIEIESAEMQYQMLADFSDEVQVMLLESAVSSREDGSDAESLKELAAAWGRGDESELTALVIPKEDEIVTDADKEYWNAMIVERNNGMTDFCIDALENSEEAFVVVGLAHFLGEDGIVNQLIEKGYTVEAVY